jgi:tetratricopeptide (TPR) repeat protein
MEVLSPRYLDAESLADVISSGSQAVEIYQDLLTGNREQYRPNLARALDNQGIYLAKAGREPEALALAKQAVGEYGKLQRSRPRQFAAGYALALEHLSSRYLKVGQHSRAAAAHSPGMRGNDV